MNFGTKKNNFVFDEYVVTSGYMVQHSN
jgi:hypothetical protein